MFYTYFNPDLGIIGLSNGQLIPALEKLQNSTLQALFFYYGAF